MRCASGSHAVTCASAMSRYCAIAGTAAKQVAGRATWTLDAYSLRNGPRSKAASAGVAELFVTLRAEAVLREIWRIGARGRGQERRAGDQYRAGLRAHQHPC